MLTLGIILFVAINLIAVYHSVQAARHLNADAKHPGWKLLTLGTFADRSEFSSKGWRHRNIALGLHTLAFAIGVVSVAFS